jgi:hypothetical protein
MPATAIAMIAGSVNATPAPNRIVPRKSPGATGIASPTASPEMSSPTAVRMNAVPDRRAAPIRSGSRAPKKRRITTTIANTPRYGPDVPRPRSSTSSGTKVKNGPMPHTPHRASSPGTTPRGWINGCFLRGSAPVASSPRCRVSGTIQLRPTDATYSPAVRIQTAA